MIGVWAGNAILDPTMFDLNDRFTHEQAGAALIEFEYFYPIKALAELDNTCRVPIGSQPNYIVPGMCPVKPKEGKGGKSCTFVCFGQGEAFICECR